MMIEKDHAEVHCLPLYTWLDNMTGVWVVEDKASSATFADFQYSWLNCPQMSKKGGRNAKRHLD